MRKAIIPLVATAAAQLLVIGSIAAAFAFQPEAAQLPIVTIPVRADIEQGECIRQDPVPYEPITYHVPLDADLQQYTAEMCDLYEVHAGRERLYRKRYQLNRRLRSDADQRHQCRMAQG